MSTLQQLSSSLSGTATAGFLPPSTNLPLANQFPTDLANVQWQTQQAWLDPVCIIFKKSITIILDENGSYATHVRSIIVGGGWVGKVEKETPSHF